MYADKEQKEILQSKGCLLTDQYLHDYEDCFVNKWDELIDWEKRAKSEGSFFYDIFRQRNVQSIMDVAAGTGFHSVRFLEQGYRVVSVDGSANMLVQAFENARDKGYILSTVHTDWRRLSFDVQGEYDALICLGNSFTHLFDEHDRRRVLSEFYSKLKPDGVLIVDQRNYDRILDEGYSSKHKYYYCGENVSAEPVQVKDDMVQFEYTFPDASVFHLNMFPLRKAYMQKLLYETGFGSVTTYGDFQETFRGEEPDFYIHVADKGIPDQS